MSAKRRKVREKRRTRRLAKSVPAVFMEWRRAWELRKAITRRIMEGAAPGEEWIAELRKELMPGEGGDGGDDI